SGGIQRRCLWGERPVSGGRRSVAFNSPPFWQPPGVLVPYIAVAKIGLMPMLQARMKTSFFAIVILGWFASAIAQSTNSFPLWADGAPGALGKEPKDIPTLTPYFPDPDKATGAALVICPGGGYGHLAPSEGVDYARFFAENGITCFVLKYRL